MAIAKPCMGLPQLLMSHHVVPAAGQQEVTSRPARSTFSRLFRLSGAPGRPVYAKSAQGLFRGLAPRAIEAAGNFKAFARAKPAAGYQWGLNSCALSPTFRGNGRRLTMLAAASVLAIGLAGCSSLFGDDDDTDAAAATGSAFTQALGKDYTDLASQASSLPAEAGRATRLLRLAEPLLVQPRFLQRPAGQGLHRQGRTGQCRHRAGAGSRRRPGPGQRSAAAWCAPWPPARTSSPNRPPAPRPIMTAGCCTAPCPAPPPRRQACKTSLDDSLLRLETAARPAPAAGHAGAGARAGRPAPAPAPAAASSDFTVYFDFDSWTLKAEQLKVLTAVINTARTGGQANITVVGHTDTSGSADYNQKLSVRRANVVVEALVDMGARRAAIHASGVGETDLAVQTGDNVKEAKNRRTVITLQP